MAKQKSILKRRLMVLLMIICLLFGGILVTANGIYSKITESKVISRTQKNLSQASVYIALLMDQAKESAQYLCKDAQLVRFANKVRPSIYDKVVAANAIGKEITLMALLNSNLDSIYIYFKEARLMTTSIYGDYLTEVLEGTAIAQAAASLGDRMGEFRYIKDDRVSKKGLVSFMIKASLYNPDIRSDVYLMINFDEAAFYQILSEMKSSSQSMPLLFSSDGTLLSAQDKSGLGLKSQLDLEKYNYKEEGYQAEHLNGKNTYVFYQNQRVHQFRLFYLMESSDIEVEQSLLTVFMGCVLLLCLGAGCTMHILYSRGVYQPLIKLVSFMKETQKGNLRMRIAVTRKDEFGYLYTAYNDMLEKIDALMQTTHQQDELRRKMEISQLQKQIDPHFLYNTLDMVNWMAKQNHVPEISQVVLSLSNIYQSAFNKGRLLITYKEAVESAESYLRIQKYRFYDKLEYRIETDETLNECRIMNLLLQSVAENAVIHGMEDMGRKGLIIIGNRYDPSNDSVWFTVTDNGQGMSEEKLKLQRKRLESETLISNSGLTNVQRRIKLYYGPQYGVHIESELNAGTKVSIHIPRIIKDSKWADFEEEEE